MSRDGFSDSCRLKNFRRIATSHDELAANFLNTPYLAAVVSYWL